MHHLRAGVEQHLPARPPEAVAPVRLLAEEEEALVEEPDLVDRRAPYEQARAHDELRLAHLVVREAARVEGVERRERGASLRRKRYSVASRHGSGSRARSAGSIRPGCAGAARRRRLADAVREGDKPIDAVADDPGVGVQDQHVAARRGSDAARSTRHRARGSACSTIVTAGKALADERRRVPSLDPLSTTTVSWPATLARHCSIHGSALWVTTTTETSAMGIQACERRPGEALPRRR